MKKIVFLIIFVSFLGCDKDDNSKGTKYFDAKNLKQLDLANIDNYWTEGINIDTSYHVAANFESHSGFIDGIQLYSGNGKEISISVFKTKEDAINAMELRINTVSCVISNGNPDEFENKWWYTDCMEYAIFESQYNTIVEIKFSSNATFELVKGILFDIANEINDRIDNLSEYVN
jgi:hypothetical protein